MTARRTNIAIFILILAGTAFVVDFVSPATPIPNIDVSVKQMPAADHTVATVSPVKMELPEFFLSHDRAEDTPVHYQSGTLIAKICVLLC